MRQGARFYHEGRWLRSFVLDPQTPMKRRAVQRTRVQVARIEARIGYRRAYERNHGYFAQDRPFTRKFSLVPKRRTQRALDRLAQALRAAANRPRSAWTT